MRKRSLIPMSTAILLVACICVTACWSAQAAAKYIVGQERKNELIQSVEENVDVLRACLPPYTRMSQTGVSLAIDPKKVSELVNSINSEDK